MKLSLPPEIQKLIDERVNSGKYANAEAVIAAAVATLDAQEAHGDFSAGELDALLASGEADVARGDTIDGATAFAELRRRSLLRRESAS